MAQASKTSWITTYFVNLVAEEPKIRTFEEFHRSIRTALNKLNAALPGKHFEMPNEKEFEERLKECFEKWKSEKISSEKNKILVNFMKEFKHKENDSAMITGLIIPPLAMAAKKYYLASEFAKDTSRKTVKNALEAVPDVVLVPSATVIVLVLAKLTGRFLLK